MAGAGALRLGPAARRLISPDRWTDGYPGPVAYSRELDVLLDWASKRNYLKRFVHNIEAKNAKRDEALNELRLAYLFDHMGFRSAVSRICSSARQKPTTNAADPRLILRAKRLPLRQLAREADLPQHAVERFLSDDKVFPNTHA